MHTSHWVHSFPAPSLYSELATKHLLTMHSDQGQTIAIGKITKLITDDPTAA